LAAGLDKNAEAFDAFGALGFGLLETGTLTSEAQPGNEQPRLFRLPRDRALINRMGFNNRGAADAAKRLRRRRGTRARLGANIGRTKRISNELAAADYLESARVLAPHVDYLVINVSSPNTPGLRALQHKAALTPLLRQVRHTLDEVVPHKHVPLLVKVAPDIDDTDIDAIAEVALELRLDGIIATNTTVSRDGLVSASAEVEACGSGGLSGPPVAEQALHVLRQLRARVGSRVTLVASGGIQTGDDAFARIRAGASLVQVYTALIYEGPGLAKAIKRRLSQCLREAGYQNLSDAVGVDA
jgi:dihydroorotate dehydrogenase